MGVPQDAPTRPLAEAGGAVLHDHGGQRHVRGCRDSPHTLRQVEVDDLLLDIGLVRTVDEVATPADPVTKLGDKLVHRLLDPLRAEPRGAEEAQKPRPRHGDDEPGRGDAVGHGPLYVGEAHAVHLAEGAVAEPLRVQRRQRGEQGPRGAPVYQVVRKRLTRESNPHCAVLITDNVDGLSDTLHGLEQRFLTKGRGVRRGTPRALRGE